MSSRQRDRRRAAATLTVGTGLVAGGGHLRGQAVDRGHELLAAEGRIREGDRLKLPGRSLAAPKLGGARPAPGLTRMRGRYVAGSAAGLIGATGMGVGAHGLHQTRRRRVAKAEQPKSFLREGLEGSLSALSERGQNLRQKDVPTKARAAPYAIGVGAAAAGGFGGHAAFNRLPRKLQRFRAAGTAVTGTAAGVASLPLGQRATRRLAPGYEVTPTGVKRAHTKPLRPSAKARVVDARPGRGTGSRREIVPSDLRKADDDPRSTLAYRGAGMSRGQKRAAVMAAGSIPGIGIGPTSAALMARRLAPPDQKNSATALQGGGYAGGYLAGGAAGALAARNKHVQAAGARVAQGGAAARQRVVTSRPGQAVVNSGPGRAVAAGQARVIGWQNAAMGKIPGKLRLKGKVGGAVIAGAYLGSKAGGFTGSQVGYTQALRNEEKRRARLSKAAAGVAPGMNRRETEQVLRRRRRNAALTTVNSTIGAAGVGLYAAPKLKRVAANPKVLSRVQNATVGTLVAGGGIGSYTGYRSAAVERKSIKAQERALGVRKALTFRAVPAGVGRTKSFRGQTYRRTPTGRVVTVRGGLV